MFNIHLSLERWKWNSDFGIYVSNKGRFRSRDKQDLPVKVNNNGYCLVYCEGTVNKYRLAHRVVMLTWRPNDDAEHLTIDHLDHNKRNNAVDNLEWVTKSENIRRAKADFVDKSVTADEEVKVEKVESAPSKYDFVFRFVDLDLIMTVEQIISIFKGNTNSLWYISGKRKCQNNEEVAEALTGYYRTKLFGHKIERIKKEKTA